MAFSSWGFLLLGSPMMVAYGITVGARSPFYLVFLAFLVAFVMIPGSLGAIGGDPAGATTCRRRPKTGLAVLLGLDRDRRRGPGRSACCGPPARRSSRDWLDALLGRLAFSQHPLLPSRWMSKGLIGAARGDWTVGLFYLMVIDAPTPALAYLLAAVVGPRPLPPRLQPRPGGPIVPQADAAATGSTPSSTAPSSSCRGRSAC